MESLSTANVEREHTIDDGNQADYISGQDFTNEEEDHSRPRATKTARDAQKKRIQHPLLVHIIPSILIS